MAQSQAPDLKLPRVAITYCTQCRWMLRAAYFSQELLSTFGTTIGEIALIPATGGIFTIQLTYAPESVSQSDDPSRSGLDAGTGDKDVEVKSTLIWDRKAEGSFPETKVLKQRIRDHIQPERDLGHSDSLSKKVAKSKSEETDTAKDGGPRSLKTLADGAANAKADAERCANCV